MEQFIDGLKNSRFIRMICNQINRMPPVVVGLLTIAAYVIGMFSLTVLCIIGVFAVFAAIMFAGVSLTTFPCGIGIAILGALLQICIWKNFNDTLPLGSMIKPSLKNWGLALVLGCMMFALFPEGRHLLLKSINFVANGDEQSLTGLEILALGWVAIAATKIPKLFSLLPQAYHRIKNELDATGLSSLQKCSEIKATTVK